MDNTYEIRIIDKVNLIVGSRIVRALGPDRLPLLMLNCELSQFLQE
jgi:hypothetical protein